MSSRRGAWPPFEGRDSRAGLKHDQADGDWAAGARVTSVGASGLRPLAAYAGIGAVLLAVGAKAVWIHTATAGEQPSGSADVTAPWPGFEVVDREGRALALSVECFDLTVSPRALWRSHTPLRLAEGIARILDGSDTVVGADVTPDAVLGRMMPREFVDGPAPGWLEAQEPQLLALDEAGAERARRWIATGEPAPDDTREDVAVEGFQVVPLLGGVPGLWTLAWQPAVALADRQRVRQLGVGSEKRPERWTRHMLDDLLEVVSGRVGEESDLMQQALLARLSESQRDALSARRGLELQGALADALWAELMPARFRVVARRVDATRAQALAKLFVAEAVSPWQAELHSRLERKHPTRPGGEPAALSAERAVDADDDAFAMLGHWGVLDVDSARRQARRTRDERPYLLPWDDPVDPVEAYSAELQRVSRPQSGLELRAQIELQDGPWSTLLDEQARAYHRRVRTVARDRRDAWKELGRLPDYFESASDAAEIPRVHSTLDANVQEMLHAELGHALDHNRAALVMGIVVDVESGDVLGVDYRSRYPYSGFAPLRHAFTPGSTFKAVIMAIALDRGYVTPESSFPSYVNRPFVVRGSSREIREAEGGSDKLELTAAEGLAYSCNAVLVQIGLRVPPPVLRGALVDLGYGQRPGASMGPEVAGHLTRLESKYPSGWNTAWTHASVSFGHEVSVTLWQHAEALATIARGGLRRPLRLLAAIDQGDRSWELEVQRGQRVLGQAACDQVLEMMHLGATIGTGSKLAHPSMHPDLAWIGTKTGTTEKVESELCLHVELQALARSAAAGVPLTDAERAALKYQRAHFDTQRAKCYTSSMCAIGRTFDGRKVMSLVVVDDPTGKEKFGSRVAGPTAIAVLRQALGLPRTYGGVDEALVDVSPDLAPDSFSSSELPWAEAATSDALNADAAASLRAARGAARGRGPVSPFGPVGPVGPGSPGSPVSPVGGDATKLDAGAREGGRAR